MYISLFLCLYTVVKSWWPRIILVGTSLRSLSTYWENPLKVQSGWIFIAYCNKSHKIFLNFFRLAIFLEQTTMIVAFKLADVEIKCSCVTPSIFLWHFKTQKYDKNLFLVKSDRLIRAFDKGTRPLKACKKVNFLL